MTIKNKIKVTLTKSVIGRIESHKLCVKGLGLRRIGQAVYVEDTPSTRGMINKIDYLLMVEEPETINHVNSAKRDSDTNVTEVSSESWLGCMDWIKYFNSNGMPGGADILLCGPYKIEEKIGELAYVLLLLNGPDREPFYKNLVLILPKGIDISLDRIKYVALQKAIELGNNLSSKKATSALDKLIKTQTPKYYSTDELSNFVQSADKRSYVYIINSSKYRDSEIDVEITGKSIVDEDIWASHLVSLSEACANSAIISESCVLIDAGEYFPIKKANSERISNVKNCGVISSNDPAGFDEATLNNFDTWVSEIKGGQKDDVFKAINSLPDSFDKQKPLLKIQVLNRAGDIDSAIGIIRSLVEEGGVFDADISVMLASIALPDPSLSEILISNVINDISTQERLEQALRVCSKLSLRDHEKLCLDKLVSLYPTSYAITDHQFSSLLINCLNISDPSKYISTAENTKYSDFSAYVLDSLQSNNDYRELISEINYKWPDYLHQAKLCFSLHASGIKNFSQAIKFACPDELSGDFSRHAVNNLLWSIESLLLSRVDSIEDVELALSKVTKYLFDNPGDEGVRNRLSKAMSTRSSGFYGVASLAKLMLSLARDSRSVKDVSAPHKNATEEELKDFLELAMTFLSSKKGVYVGEVELPDHIIKPSADQLLEKLKTFINYIPPEKDSIELLQILVTIGCALYNKCTGANKDLDIIRMAANRMHLAGQMQMARDYAEHALSLASNNAERSRLAWLVYTEIYQRGTNYIDALIGMVCVFTSPVKITKEDAFYEVYCATRILRDLGLIDLATEFLESCDVILKDLSLDESSQHRLETTRLGIDFYALAQEKIIDEVALTDLAKKALDNLISVIDNNDEILPISSLVAQIIRIGNENKFELPDEINDWLHKAMELADNNSKNYIEILRSDNPTSHDLVKLVRSTEAARFSDDVGYDVNLLVQFSRRLLSSNEAKTDSDVALFAGELTTDICVQSDQNLGSSSNSWFPAEKDIPSKQAIEISKMGIDVTLLAIDSNGRLVRVTTHNGEIHETVCEENSTFSYEAYNTWTEKYPYSYSDAENSNIFYITTENLGLSHKSINPSVFILDTRLQQLSPSLIRLGPDLLGTIAPTAVAPSINWLHRATTVGVSHLTSSKAWISTSVDEGANGTLQMVADRLADTLNKYDIPLSQDSKLPDNMEGSELAIVAAHGGLHPGGRFFKSVSDEDSLKINSMTLSKALRNSGVAILFICSGGRFDKDPLSNTTIALPKDLLNAGCSAVIGSPWPLDARVPSHWLPAFLKAWNEGETILKANWKANKAVESAMGISLSYQLALNIYGNPLIKKKARN